MTAALLALLVAASPSSTEADPPAEALEVARLTMPRSTWDGYRDQAAPSLGLQLEKETAANALILKMPGAEVVKRLWEEALPYEDFLRFYAGSLAAGLSSQELTEVAAFHRSPAGKKLLGLQRQLEVEAQRWIEERLPRLGAALHRSRDAFVGPGVPPQPKR